MHLGIVVLLVLPLCFVCVQLEWVAADDVAATRIGVNYYGTRVGESAERLVQLLRSRRIGRIRLHDADSAILRAIGTGTGTSTSREAVPIEVIVGVKNDEIVEVGVSPASARSWIARNVVQYLPAANIIAIAVGSEVFTLRQAAAADDDDQSTTIVPFLVPAMRNLYAALSEVGLEKQIKVSAPQSAQVLSSYFPPSSAIFNEGITTDRAMAPLLDFLASSGSYFMLNLYPQDLQHDGVVALKKQQQRPQEGFPAAGGMVDPQTGRHYSSMVDVLTDAVSVAMASSLGHHQLSVIGIEMEWSGTSASSVFGGLAVDIDPRFIKHLVTIPPQVEQKVVRVEALFSSRRFLMDPLQAKQQPDEGGKRRKLANRSWCVAKSDASTASLQSALDWACGSGGGVDCTPVSLGKSCYIPNTIVAHASFAFNSYYQKQSYSTVSCDFGGLAEVTTSDPSTASCVYSSSTSANGTPTVPTGTTIPNVASSSRLTWARCRVILSSFILIFLIKRSLPDFKV